MSTQNTKFLNPSLYKVYVKESEHSQPSNPESAQRHVQSKASRGEQNQFKFGAARVELEETKQNLQKAKEEGDFMAHCLQSLREELEQTRREIHELKSTRDVVLEKKVPLTDFDDDDEIHEQLKFIKQPVEVKTQIGEDDDHEIEFEKKRSVKFASPPMLTKIIAVNKLEEYVKKETYEKSKKKLKRKPLIRALFPKKKGNQEK